MIENTIAYCGLDCSGCPIRLATLEQDKSKQQNMRIEIAKVCNQQYSMNILPQDVTDCDGCRSQLDRMFSGCIKCEIRKCAIERQLTSCSYCLDYACGRLSKHFETDPAARNRLESIRSRDR